MQKADEDYEGEANPLAQVGMVVPLVFLFG